MTPLLLPGFHQLDKLADTLRTSGRRWVASAPLTAIPLMVPEDGGGRHPAYAARSAPARPIPWNGSPVLSRSCLN